jgi:hypothetical protein
MMTIPLSPLMNSCALATHVCKFVMIHGVAPHLCFLVRKQHETGSNAADLPTRLSVTSSNLAFLLTTLTLIQTLSPLWLCWSTTMEFLVCTSPYPPKSGCIGKCHICACYIFCYAPRLQLVAGSLTTALSVCLPYTNLLYPLVPVAYNSLERYILAVNPSIQLTSGPTGNRSTSLVHVFRQFLKYDLLSIWRLLKRHSLLTMWVLPLPPVLCRFLNHILW